jgi:MFS family permease
MKLNTKLNLIYLSEFFVYFHLFGGVLIPFFMIWGGLTMTEIMLLQSWFSFCVLILEIPTGTLADKLGRKNTMLIGLAIWAIGIWIYAAYQNFSLYILAEVFWALSTALFSGSKEALIYDTLVDHNEEKQSEKVFGRFKISHLLGIMIAAPVGSWIGAQFGLQWAMMTMIIPVFLAGLILLFVPEPKAALQIIIDDDTPSIKPVAWQATRNFWKQITEGWQFFKNHPSLGIMTFDMVTLWTLSFMIIWFHQLLLEDIGIDREYFGWFISLSLGFQILVLNAYPHIEKKLGSRKRYLSLSGYLPALGFLIIAIYPHVVTILLALFFCSGFGLTRRTLYVSYMNSFISSHQRATVNSFISIGIHIVAFVIKPGLGFLADWSLSAVLFILAFLCVIITFFSKVEESMLVYDDAKR